MTQRQQPPHLSSPHSGGCCSRTLPLILLLPAPQRRADDDGDGHVLLELEDDNTSLDSLAVKIGRDVTGCTRLPVQGWASCQLAPAAASAAAAEKVVTTLKSVELVMGQLRMNAGFGGGEQPSRAQLQSSKHAHCSSCMRWTGGAKEMMW